LADEPTGNLDTVSSNEVMGIFSRLNAEGRTVVIITHEDDIASFCKRVVRLRDGQIYEDTRAVPVHSPPPLLDIRSGPAAVGFGDDARIGGTP
jgi:putative ABC transport system ATP-binding protein